MQTHGPRFASWVASEKEIAPAKSIGLEVSLVKFGMFIMAFGIEIDFISSQLGFCEHVLHPGRYDPPKGTRAISTRIDYHGIWNCSIQRVDQTVSQSGNSKDGRVFAT